MSGTVLEAGDKRMNKTQCLPLNSKQFSMCYKKVSNQLRLNEG